MRIAVIACETFRQELDKVLGDDPDIIYKEYVEFGLHEYPKELRAALIEKVNSWEGRADVVLLGYGICQSLKDIENELKVPTIKLPADDCIGVLLTPEEYDQGEEDMRWDDVRHPFLRRLGQGVVREGHEAQDEDGHARFRHRLHPRPPLQRL